MSEKKKTIEMKIEEALKKAITDAVPKGTTELNLKAYEKGRSHALSLTKGAGVKANE